MKGARTRLQDGCCKSHSQVLHTFQCSRLKVVWECFAHSTELPWMNQQKIPMHNLFPLRWRRVKRKAEAAVCHHFLTWLGGSNSRQSLMQLIEENAEMFHVSCHQIIWILSCFEACNPESSKSHPAFSCWYCVTLYVLIPWLCLMFISIVQISKCLNWHHQLWGVNPPVVYPHIVAPHHHSSSLFLHASDSNKKF